MRLPKNEELGGGAPPSPLHVLVPRADTAHAFLAWAFAAVLLTYAAGPAKARTRN